ncbi:MAG: PsbP-related protein [Methanobacterium sp.]
MKKYIYILVILIVAISLFLYFNSSNAPYNPLSGDNKVKTYSANGISFNYSENWEITNKTGKYVIVYLKDPTANETDGKPGAVVEISKKAAEGIPLEKFYDEVKTGASGVPGYQQISDRKIEVDNETAYEFVANGMDNGVEEQFRVVLFEKGGYIYMISCGTRSPTTLSNKNRDFDVIINSFNVQ